MKYLATVLVIGVTVIGCVTKSAPYETIKITNYKTGKIGGSCDRSLDSFIQTKDIDATLKLAYEAKAKLKKANISSDGGINLSLKSVTETVRLISRQHFEYMSFLYPYCKANAEGKLSDQDYLMRMNELLDIFIKKNAVSVSLARKADFSGSGCDGDKRKYSNVVNDTLIFSEPIEHYIAQAYTSGNNGTHTVEVSYNANGKIVAPIAIDKPFFGNIKRKAVKIPVNGKSLNVTYKYKQTPPPDDNEWGLSFVSSLPITSITASVILPPGKEVTGLHKGYADHALAFQECSFTYGNAPALHCSSFSSEPSVPNNLVWKWNIFNGC